MKANKEFESQLKEICKRSWLERWEDFLYGYDYFISYRWADGRNYALALAEQLRNSPERFSVFLDSSEYAAGDNLPQIGNRAIAKSSSLVLVATPGVAESSHVKRELKIYRATGRRTIAIDFEGTLDALRKGDSDFVELLRSEELCILEPINQLDNGPSESTLARLRQALLVQLKGVRRRKAIAWVMFTLCVLLSALGALGVYSKTYFDRTSAHAYFARLDSEVSDGDDITISIPEETLDKIDCSILAEHCNALGRVVDLNFNGQTLVNVGSLGQISGIRSLNLYRCSGVNNLSFAGELKELQALMLNGNGLDDSVLLTLPDNMLLREMILSNNRVTNSGLAMLLEKCPDLYVLELFGCSGIKVNGAFIDSLANRGEKLAELKNVRLDVNLRGIELNEDTQLDIVPKIDLLRKSGHRIRIEESTKSSRERSNGEV